MIPSPTLLRISQLARFWGRNQQTLLTWIRLGRLPAIRSPGGHYRVRPADVRAFCAREGLPVPPGAASAEARVVVAGAQAAKALRAADVAVEGHDDPYDALVRAARGDAALLVLPAASSAFDAAAAIAALRRAPATRALPVLVTGPARRSRVEALEQAGATRVVTERDGATLVEAVRALLGAS